MRRIPRDASARTCEIPTSRFLAMHPHLTGCVAVPSVSSVPLENSTLYGAVRCRIAVAKGIPIYVYRLTRM
jgi:hypothetical protein